VNALDLATDIDLALSRRLSEQIELAVMGDFDLHEEPPREVENFEFDLEDLEEYELPRYYQVAMKD
jgi:hypothetical protein